MKGWEKKSENYKKSWGLGDKGIDFGGWTLIHSYPQLSTKVINIALEMLSTRVLGKDSRTGKSGVYFLALIHRPYYYCYCLIHGETTIENNQETI